MFRAVLCTLVLTFSVFRLSAKEFQLKSPDGKVVVAISVGEDLGYTVTYNNNEVLDFSTIAFEFVEAAPIGKAFTVLDTKQATVDETWKPVLKRYDEIQNNYNSLVVYTQEIRFPKRLVNVEFRAYNDGVAYRVEFPEQFANRENTMTDELSVFNFADDFTCWSADYKSYVSSQETEFWKKKISDITDKMVTGLPITIEVADNCYAALTEADLTDYAGMFVKPYSKAGKFALRSDLAPLPGQQENGNKVVFKFPHLTPWRVLMLGETPGDLVESEIVQNLNDPCEIEDPSWIKPGISAWDHWWSGEVKMEQDVILQYIDLASEMGWDYMLIDWQWYGMYNQAEADITTPAEQLDMPAIFEYAKSKNVKCWLWMYWTDVDRSDFDAACALYHEWGAAGIKIDFMDRSDQEMVNWYHRIVTTAAKHQLMVDFHGAYKPTGWRRTYPNLMTREGVMGNEYNKWWLCMTPEHLCTLPFTRMLAGPMDYTPGGFLNRMPNKFRNGTPANVMGSRANTLAQFVVYDSPYQVACDHPDNYRGQTGVEFLKKVKTVWDDTKVLNGAIGEYITMARRNENDWFIGAMTNSEDRKLEVTLDFLTDGEYKMTIYSDTEETPDNGEAVAEMEKVVKKGDVIEIDMVAGGGYAAVLEPVQ
nr:glycoside hydrolase family 97 protein [uncultured Draconibacterium sp.]